MVPKKTILILLSTVIFATVAVFCFGYLPRDKFAFGVEIGGQYVGGLSEEEAKEKLTKNVKEFSERNLVFTFLNDGNPQAKTVKINDIGINFNIEESIEEPFKIGKNKNFFDNLKEKILALEKKYDFPLVSNFPDLKFENFLTENFGEFEILPQNSEVNFNEKTLEFEIKEPKEGLLFPKERIKQGIKTKADFLKISYVYLSLEKTLPEIGQEETEKAVSEAKDILERSPYLFLAGEKAFILNKEILGTWFFFSPKRLENQAVVLEISLDKNLIKNRLEDISGEINIEPQNAKLNFEQGEVKIISPSKGGSILKIDDESIKEIEEKILKKENKIYLSVEEAEPKISEEKIQQLSIEKLIGSGNSNFAGSPKNRINNIKAATAKFNGFLIEPGKTFSFNEILGEVGPSQGYLPELVIKNNKTVPEYGGGICQVSTTMFRAAVNSGMEIIERKPHAYPVKYYNPQGFDATVYLPSPDLKFKNNTNGYILIQSKIEGTNLTFEFYGEEDGRKVIVKGPYQYDIKEDGSMKARLEEEVWKDGVIIYKKTFFSTYKSPTLYPVKTNPLE